MLSQAWEYFYLLSGKFNTSNWLFLGQDSIVSDYSNNKKDFFNNNNNKLYRTVSEIRYKKHNVNNSEVMTKQAKHFTQNEKGIRTRRKELVIEYVLFHLKNQP